MTKPLFFTTTVSRPTSILAWTLLVALAMQLTKLPSLALSQNPGADASTWIQPTHPDDPLIWGHRDGILFGLPSLGGLGGPRGLIRVAVHSKQTGKPELLNFIAIEPVVRGEAPRRQRMAYSELERSELDLDQQGKRLWVDGEEFATVREMTEGERHFQRLSVRVNVEKFQANGAHVDVIVSIDSDRPHELLFEPHALDDSLPIEELTLSATMGNKARLRQLWLKDEIVSSLKLYTGYDENRFVEHDAYPLSRMLRTGDDHAIVLATNDEAAPWDVPWGPPNPAKQHWRYTLHHQLTQYWKVPKQHIQPDLRVRVNGRRVYWNSEAPIPGGTAFENFEVRQVYQPGQVFIFGITPIEPAKFQPPIPNLPQT